MLWFAQQSHLWIMDSFHMKLKHSPETQLLCFSHQLFFCLHDQSTQIHTQNTSKHDSQGLCTKCFTAYHTMLLAETDAAHSTPPCACPGALPEKLPSYSHPEGWRGRSGCSPLRLFSGLPSTTVSRSLSTALMYRAGLHAQHCHTPVKPQGGKCVRQNSRLFNFKATPQGEKVRENLGC